MKTQILKILRWLLNSPPKAHAFVCSPLQSIIGEPLRITVGATTVMTIYCLGYFFSLCAFGLACSGVLPFDTISAAPIEYADNGIAPALNEGLTAFSQFHPMPDVDSYSNDHIRINARSDEASVFNALNSYAYNPAHILQYTEGTPYLIELMKLHGLFSVTHGAHLFVQSNNPMIETTIPFINVNTSYLNGEFINIYPELSEAINDLLQLIKDYNELAAFENINSADLRERSDILLGILTQLEVIINQIRPLGVYYEFPTVDYDSIEYKLEAYYKSHISLMNLVRSLRTQE